MDDKIKETTKFIMYVLCRISLLNVADVSYDVVVNYDIYIVVLRCSLLVIITRLLLSLYGYIKDKQLVHD